MLMSSEIGLKSKINSLETVELDGQNHPEIQVLVVDDDDELRSILAFALAQSGYKTTTVNDGQAALKMVKEKQPDLVILDLMLPKMDGMEVCWRIRQFSDIPILMLTALDSDCDKVWGLKAGADDYITKPFSMRELLARVEAVLRRYVAVQNLLEKRSNSE